MRLTIGLICPPTILDASGRLRFKYKQPIFNGLPESLWAKLNQSAIFDRNPHKSYAGAIRRAKFDLNLSTGRDGCGKQTGRRLWKCNWLAQPGAELRVKARALRDGTTFQVSRRLLY
jgi:hypothetical protein